MQRENHVEFFNVKPGGR